MKILYLITRAERGGAQVHVLDLLQGFRDRCTVEVAAGEDGFLLEEARKLGIPCHIVPSLRQPMQPLKDARALLEIVNLLKRVKPDLLHTHTSKAGVLGRIAAWLSRVPAVFTAHTWCFAEGTSRLWKLLGAPLERLAALPGGRIINVSEANRELALRYRIAQPRSLVTIHNGAPEGTWNGSRTPSQPPIVLVVARFAPQKNHAMLLRALSEVTVPFQVQFAGNGPTRPDMEMLAEDLKLSDRAEFLGDRSDVARLLDQASVFALPTNWEGFPLSILEAMRAGLPVVANDVGGVREAVQEGRNGFLVQRGDTAGFAQALQRLLSNPDLRERMGLASRRVFEERFTTEQMLRNTLKIYQQSVSDDLHDYSSIRVSSQKNS